MKKIIPFPWPFPLSQAIVHDAKYTMEISWLIGTNPETKTLQEGIEAQTEQIIKNLKTTLAEIGWDMSNIVKCRIFLTDMWDYQKMNEVYATYFTQDFPTRFAIEVSKLPAGALVEIECTAVWDTIKE